MYLSLLRFAAAALVLLLNCSVWSGRVDAYTANKVWFMFKPEGGYRVYVNYTVPELKEYREVQVNFTSKKAAESYYWNLIRGADFYLPDSETIRFSNQVMEPEPW
jgi:hypothetical protein